MSFYWSLFVKIVGLDGIYYIFEGFFVVDSDFCKLEQVLEFFVNCNVTSQCIFDELSIFKFAREMVDCMFELFFVLGFLQKDLVLYLLGEACVLVVEYKHDFDVAVRAFGRV